MRKAAYSMSLAFGLAATILAQGQTKESQASTTPTAAVEILKEGNARFVAGKPVPHDHNARVIATASGQFPIAAVVSCMDSRASAELVFDQGVGDIFSLRVAGPVVDSNFLGSLEFAVKVIGVKLIVVMGHTECGAVKGAIDDVKLGNLTALLADIRPAVVAAGPPAGTSKDKAFVDRVAEQNVRLGMKAIREHSPLLKAALDAGQVGLVGAMYDVATGKVTFSRD